MKLYVTFQRLYLKLFTMATVFKYTMIIFLRYGHKKYLFPCYICVDVAYVIKHFCRIKCLTGIKNKNVKEFKISFII